jgi:hypothetical protein
MYGPPKIQQLSTKLHGVTSHKTEIFTTWYITLNLLITIRTFKSIYKDGYVM